MITLADRDVKAAKKMLRHFMDKSREIADSKKATTFYYTLLIVMNVISTEYIQSVTPEVLALLLNSASENNEQK